MGGLTLPGPLSRAEQRGLTAEKRRIVGNLLALGSPVDFDGYLTGVRFP